jgi:hypothetical protein
MRIEAGVRRTTPCVHAGQEALVVALSDSIEEEVTLRIGDWELVCFARAMPEKVFAGRRYLVEMSIDWMDDGNFVESETDEPELRRVGDTYAYDIWGRLHGSVLDAGVKFEDPWLATEFAYLSGKQVRVRVARIGVSFNPSLPK